jgi:cyclic pyranopterin phosphate synthase
MVLIDSFGRPLLNLRVAITRECNLRCPYCHREGEERNERNDTVEMTVDEVVRIVRVAVGLGISKVKLTGGEPLMRKDVVEIIRGIASLQGLKDLSMTTNGTLLTSLAKDLRASGLMRVNINLPTINREVYNKLTGGRLEDVLGGVKAAVDVGFYPVKLNMLVLKDVNDDAVSEMMEFAKVSETILQLIELEPINISNDYYHTYHKPLDDYESMLRQRAVRVETRHRMQNRPIYHLPDAKVEVVHPIENTAFCTHCTRLRVTSDGKLKPCLMRNDNLVDTLASMRNGASDKELIELFKLANRKREPYNKVHGAVLSGLSEKQMELIPVTNSNPYTVSAFFSLGRDYLEDLPLGERERFLQSILAHQGEPNRWLLLLRFLDEYVGLVHMKIDRDERPGWGFILEFYVVQNKRGRGWGRRLFNLITKILKARGVKNIWLLTDSAAEQFWRSLGFRETSEIDAETGQKVMVISI